jgi:hypothetical protein
VLTPLWAVSDAKESSGSVVLAGRVRSVLRDLEGRQAPVQVCVFPPKDDNGTSERASEAKLAHLARQAAFQRHVLGPKSRFSWTGATVVLPVAPNVTRICGEL